MQRVPCLRCTTFLSEYSLSPHHASVPERPKATACKAVQSRVQIPPGALYVTFNVQETQRNRGATGATSSQFVP